MKCRAFLLLLSLAAAAACGEGGSASAPAATLRPHTLTCAVPDPVEAFAWEQGSVIVACEVERGTDPRPLTLVEQVVEPPPFVSAMLVGESASGGPVYEVLYVPEDGGPHEGVLRLRYLSAGEERVVEVGLQGIVRAPKPEWDPFPDPPPCRADGEAPLLDQALALAGLDRDTFTYDVDLAAVEALSDPFRLSWFDAVRAHPHRAGCFEGMAAGAFDRLYHQRHPVAHAIRHAANLLDRPMAAEVEPPGAIPFAEGLAALCAATGCGEPSGELPPDLAYTLSPILGAIAEGIEARRQMDGASERDPADWWERGGNYNLGGSAPDPKHAPDQAYLLGHEGRRRLYEAAAKIAFAVEEAAWERYRGREGIRWDLRTDAGWIRIRDGAAHRWEDDGEPLLLLVDLGGDDEYLLPVAANTAPSNPVSVAIDLDGADRYGYEAVAHENDRAGLLPSDADGRARNGASLSRVSRQGAARNGIALLFDLGDGDDRYESLRASQGYAHLGVGVLFDGGGNDVYLGEALVQGAAQFGIGLLIDAGNGDDVRRAFSQAQGFGYVAGAGILLDGGGDDLYHCDNGSPEHGGIPGVYPSPQMPEDGNTSLCQGAGFGMRDDARELWLSGGIGILRDLGGDDTYEASVFAQGAGYWQGTGLLSDAFGADSYNAFWYVQGAAAHFAVGILADGGSQPDAFGTRLPARNMSLGSGHDFSTGVLISEGGDDVYHLGPLAAGASNCNGVGLFVDNGGDDTYQSRSDYGSGMGNFGTGCAEHQEIFRSIGVMIDAGGDDTYLYPESSFPVPADGATWGHARGGRQSEHGAGLDAAGEAGVHVESGR